MNFVKSRISHIVLMACCMLAISFVTSHAQTNREGVAAKDTLQEMLLDPIPAHQALTKEDSLKLSETNTGKNNKPQRDWNTWRPTPKRAMWLAIVLPGAGQIYNRKYWKLPLVYGGFVGCIYAIQWNNTMYKDYSQAYLDIMDTDPTTNSFNQFLHLGATITEANMAQYQSLFKKRKDRYRRWRDLSIFCLIGVYALSIIDAYVDASLSEFDISDDLSLRIEPTVLNNQLEKNPIKSSAIGLNCSLRF